MIRNLIANVLAVLAFSSVAFTAAAAVDANQATRADLETVKGIGPGLSGKIIDARKTGEFKDWTEMVDRVGGIGAGNAAKLSQAGLTVRGGGFDGQAVTSASAAKVSKDGSSAKPAKAAKSTDKSKAVAAPT